jgi:hypothetical protein
MLANGGRRSTALPHLFKALDEPRACIEDWARERPHVLPGPDGGLRSIVANTTLLPALAQVVQEPFRLAPVRQRRMFTCRRKNRRPDLFDEKQR